MRRKPFRTTGYEWDSVVWENHAAGDGELGYRLPLSFFIIFPYSLGGVSHLRFRRECTETHPAPVVSIWGLIWIFACLLYFFLSPHLSFAIWRVFGLVWFGPGAGRCIYVVRW